MSNNIEHIFYINLDKRTDRKIEFEKYGNLYNKLITGIALQDDQENKETDSAIMLIKI